MTNKMTNMVAKSIEGKWEANIIKKNKTTQTIFIEVGNDIIGVLSIDEEVICEANIEDVEYDFIDDDFEKIDCILKFPGEFMITRIELLKKV